MKEEYSKECNKEYSKAVMRNDSGGSHEWKNSRRSFEDVELASGRNKKVQEQQMTVNK